MSRISFRQLLLLAFILIALVLSGAAIQGLRMLESFAGQSHHAAQSALQLTAAIQLIGERSVDMERSARQYLVLEDATLLERLGRAKREALESVKHLETLRMPEFSAPLAAWREAADDLLEALGKPADAERVGVMLARLGSLNDTLAQTGRRSMEAHNRELLDELESNRAVLGWQVGAAIVGSLILALLFGRWLVRPVARLERAIEGLGESRLDREIDIVGPADLRRVGRRLDWLRQRLVDLEADRLRVLRHVSHELKTPLAALREGVALLEDRVAGPLVDAQVEVVKILQQNSITLQSRIEALLGYNAAAFDARRLRRQAFNPRVLVEKVVRDQALQWQAREARVSVAGRAPPIQADPEKLGIVIGNLLSNAIAFSPLGGNIRFLVSRSGAALVIECLDEGPGVAPADAARVFDPFYQGTRRPAKGNGGGSGIGLSIVRELVVAHGGQVKLVPSEHGACFRIEIPYEN
ncbi:sensor histidine kinase [Cognatazoarcus halotolerans]|uniref:sensor histidine kinase n=1 Tax=Cognatazoarcus halotolerans TaxID=2686016 RepID=UPI00135CA4BC|nr:HAMP domain-containing sensor histidine kinase [Cognatazoarcus halotolerans]MBX3678987.1 HAMP domain-containing histidine kinase [Rhodocyclaceae bacterium]MCB1898898.1 HAMP domain-containing histidine kinase [Rhodocyclaceae bacterium]MCP5309117.1 HAMP domain-containing histidine kinase [Zoogloeaceae bacterium]